MPNTRVLHTLAFTVLSSIDRWCWRSMTTGGNHIYLSATWGTQNAHAKAKVHDRAGIKLAMTFRRGTLLQPILLKSTSSEFHFLCLETAASMLI